MSLDFSSYSCPASQRTVQVKLPFMPVDTNHPLEMTVLRKRFMQEKHVIATVSNRIHQLSLSGLLYLRMNPYKGEKSLLCFSVRVSRWGGVYSVTILKCLTGHFLKSALDATGIETARGSDTQVEVPAMSLSKAIKCACRKEPLTRMSQSAYYSSNWTYGMKGRLAPSSGDYTVLLPKVGTEGAINTDTVQAPYWCSLGF